MVYPIRCQQHHVMRRSQAMDSRVRGNDKMEACGNAHYKSPAFIWKIVLCGT